MEVSRSNQAQEKISEGENGFVWQDYLDASGSFEVPQIMFPHVELTLQSGIEIGMSLEVPTTKDANQDTSYWIATIVMACGPLLRLRYFGGDDRSLEFWFNLTKEAAHELGWCARKNKRLQPPEAVLQRSPDCMEKLAEYLDNARSVPQEMLTGEGLSMTDRIKQGMKVEVSDLQHPYKLWVATIIENVGGRLLLRYDTPGTRVKDFWMFCTTEHLHRYGFASGSDSRWFLEPPSSIVESHTYEEWKEVTASRPKDQENAANLFDHEIDHPRHKFKTGMKLEAIVPSHRTRFAPATIIKVFDETYFLVQIDNHDEQHRSVVGVGCSRRSEKDQRFHQALEKNTWLCTADHPYIFPVGWAKSHGLRLTKPRGWSYENDQFEWDSYLRETQSFAAPDDGFTKRESAIEAGYEAGMRLEAVDPRDENIICAAHIAKVMEDLLWIKLDNFDDRRDHIVHMHSMQIFPVGWCESNHYPLKPPRDYVEICKKLEKSSREEERKSTIDIPISEPRSSLWCPKIYFNYRCFTGPMISKGKLATLPKAVGPGPVILVMREVLSMIVSVGYRSARILKVLQCDSKPDPGYHLEVLKAKHKNNVYRANVAVITSGDMVPEFCRNICKKLMVCPNLFGPLHVPEDDCPDRCHKASKNKFTTVVSSTSKRGKPGYTSILVQRRAWGGRRKRRRGRWANREREIVNNYDRDDDMSYLSLDLAKNVSESPEDIINADRQPLSEIDIMIQKDMEKPEKSDDLKGDMPSSNNVSDDSRSSFNDRKSKDSNDVGSPGSLNSKGISGKFNQNGNSMTRAAKRDREWDTSIESDCSDADARYVKLQKKQRRPKTRKLDSNPLFWTVDDVFRYLRKTNDCKDIAYRVKQEEIDGLAFLLLNLPSLTEHMKLRTSLAMKLCRHVEQVKVTFFLRHINEVEPEQYQIV